MGTSIAALITDHAMVEINDINLDKQLQDYPALFFRRMWMYVKNAIPIFNNPPELQQWLAYTAPQFGEYNWTGATSAQTTEVDTGLKGFDLMSVSVLSTGMDGEICSEPYTQASYDAETGVVTFPPGVVDGTQFQMDFYLDGAFQNDLKADEMRILGLCVAMVWYQRFAGNWLNMQPKLMDKSFSVGSEANHIRAMTERFREIRQQVYGEIQRYAQNTAYRDMVQRGGMAPLPRR